jgi:AbrB family looped-hinge helix DNA binding protein
MKEIVSTIRSNGRVTIPAQVRRHLGVSTHDKIAFVLEEGGVVKLVGCRYPTVASLRGAAGSLATRVPWPEMRDAAHEERLAAKLSRKS